MSRRLPLPTVPVPSSSAVVTVVPAVTPTRLRLYSDVPLPLPIAYLALIRLLPLVGYLAEGGNCWLEIAVRTGQPSHLDPILATGRHPRHTGQSVTTGSG